MNMSPLSDRVFVSGQIKPQHIAQIAKAGIKVIVNNRPDGEAFSQPNNAQITQAAKIHDIKVHYVPVGAGIDFASQAQTLKQILDQSDGPVLAYCRSGSRSTHLWGLSQSGIMSPQDIIAKGAQAGYDISAIMPMLKND